MSSITPPLPAAKTVQLTISHGENDCLITTDGNRYIDMVSGFGSVLLGHANKQINAQVKNQLDLLSHSGRLPTPIRQQACDLLLDFLPDQLQQLGLYTGGAEATEFSLRVASCSTGRPTFIGFENSMHGKSFATAQLGWRNELVDFTNDCRIPFLPEYSEDQSLAAVTDRLQLGDVAAVLIEPMLGSSGGHSASPGFYKELSRQCKIHGSFLIFDEILTGFRAASPFLFKDFDLTPDMLVFGKSVGNGFPVSCIALNNEINISPNMLPGSTFSENPISAAAIVATLTELKRIDLAARLATIGTTIQQKLSVLERSGFRSRGRGAFWCLEVPAHLSAANLTKELLESGVIFSSTKRHIRLLPAITVSDFNLARACDCLVQTCERAK